MKLGAEPRKVAVLAVLGAAAVYLFYTNVLSSETDGPEPSRPSARREPAQPVTEPQSPLADLNRERLAARARRGRGITQDFRPTFRPRRPEDRPDPTTVDPTLRLEVLAKVRAVPLEGGQRSLFDFSSPPPPKTAEPKIIPGALKPDRPKPDETPASLVKPASESKPPPPPIHLKFYGFIAPEQSGDPKRAFFLDGDDILVAAEGEVMKRRYKVVRIGVTTVVVQDIEHQNEQTLTLEEQAQSG